FHGWQRQKEHASVQGAVEAALARIGEPGITIAAAGRTDAGVHGLGQVAHGDLSRDWDPFRLSEALNYHLKPAPVAILKAARVDDEFHARFSAVERQYLFRLLTRRAPEALERGRVWRVGHALSLAPMQEAAAHLLGRHDYTTFRSSICQAESPVKSVDEITITEHPAPGGAEFRFTVRARSFLHNQVRSFVGTLERVGAGAWAPDDVRTALEARTRAACGPVCPPQGLYLARVGYPEDPFS
ncbi:MAG TPA: tRNA pseudouridine(38-40) synthase TruA, partial [Aliiroseovarius sp.]|nr:tRNA pseudouridine(38-40) synthase TruA [Aliiroseovarius sp.]